MNVSVLALLHITELLAFPGHLSLATVISSITSLARVLSRSHKALNDVISVISHDPLTTDDVRVPLDIHRTGMRSLQWRPYMLTDLTVSSQVDLVQI